jgi:hypothetical protein
MRMENGKLRQTGTLTLDGKKYPQDETWERLDLPAQDTRYIVAHGTEQWTITLSQTERKGPLT